MTIDTLTPVYDLDGEQLKGPPECPTCRAPAGKPMTLRSVCCNALLGGYPDEPNLSGEEKVRRFTLAQKIHAEDSVTLTAEDTALVKKLVAKAWPPLVVGQAWSMLDGDN